MHSKLRNSADSSPLLGSNEEIPVPHQNRPATALSIFYKFFHYWKHHHPFNFLQQRHSVEIRLNSAAKPTMMRSRLQYSLPKTLPREPNHLSSDDHDRVYHLVDLGKTLYSRRFRSNSTSLRTDAPWQSPWYSIGSRRAMWCRAHSGYIDFRALSNAFIEYNVGLNDEVCFTKLTTSTLSLTFQFPTILVGPRIKGSSDFCQFGARALTPGSERDIFQRDVGLNISIQN